MTTQTMRAAWYEYNGDAQDVLKIGSIKIPEVASGQVRVRLYASGINPVDIKRRKGYRHDGPLQYPWVIPHDDGAGVIDAVGEGVPSSRVGERVWIYNTYVNGTNISRPFGTAAEYAVLPSVQAVHLPDNVSFAEGACIGVPAMTAHRCVFADGPVTDQIVFVAGGSGGVGQYAIQFAKWSGATVITTASSPEKAEIVRSIGADYVIDYKKEDVATRVDEITEEKGVDRIVEVAFGSNIAMDVAIDKNMLKPNGVIATFGSDDNFEPEIPFIPLIVKAATIHFVHVFILPEPVLQKTIADITTCLETEILRHPIDHRFSLEEVAAAHEAVENGSTIGKNIVDI